MFRGMTDFKFCKLTMLSTVIVSFLVAVSTKDLALDIGSERKENAKIVLKEKSLIS